MNVLDNFFKNSDRWSFVHKVVKQHQHLKTSLNLENTDRSCLILARSSIASKRFL